MIADKVLIDTSIWIEYFRDRLPQITEQGDEILSRDGAYIPKVVIAELIQGAHSEKEIAVIESFVDAFHIIDQTESTWAKAGRLSFPFPRSSRPKSRSSSCRPSAFMSGRGIAVRRCPPAPHSRMIRGLDMKQADFPHRVWESLCPVEKSSLIY